MSLFEEIETANRIIIYGAGVYAKRMLSYVCTFAGADKLAGVTATDADGGESVFGYPVMPLESFSDFRAELVVIAISEKKAGGIRERLEQNGFHRSVSMKKADLDCILLKFEALPLQRNKLFIDCYDGMGYRCSCKYVAKYILEHHLPIEIVWKKRKQFSSGLPEEIREIDVESPYYLKELYTSKFILTNVVCNKVRPEQYSIWMWHGTPFKLVGAAPYEKTEENKKRFQKMYSGIDLFVSNCRVSTEAYRNDFYYKGEITEWGCPRNDILLSPGHRGDSIKSKMGISEEKNVLLYMPTFREDMASSFSHYDLDIENVLKALRNSFRKDFVFVYRFHHWLYGQPECMGYYNEGINATMYEDTQELLLMSDVLITDYSSVMWDFSLMRKPVFLYQNDESEYKAARGFYRSPEEWPYPKAHSSEEMVRMIERFDDTDYQKKLDLYFNDNISYESGSASQKIAERMLDVMEQPLKYGENRS